jgi:hypothetical protein
MKNLFHIGVLSFVSSAAVGAFACSPPLPVEYQRHQLTIAIASEALGSALKTFIDADPMVWITSVTFEEGVLVTLSNECSIRLSLKYLPPEDAGMCPRLDRVEAETACPQG